MLSRTSEPATAVGLSMNVLGPAGALLCALGQVLAGWSQTWGFALSALGALLLVVWGWTDAQARRQGVVAAVGILSATLTPVSASWFGPLMLTRPKEKTRSGWGSGTYWAVAIGLVLGVLSAAAITIWWYSRTEIVFYELVPTELITSMPVAVVVGGCAVAAAFNSIWEETLWRQMLVRPFTNSRTVVQLGAAGALALSFGLAHLHSAPGGWIGVALTTAFALAAHAACLYLRRGLLAAMIGHFIADFTLLLLMAYGG